MSFCEVQLDISFNCYWEELEMWLLSQQQQSWVSSLIPMAFVITKVGKWGPRNKKQTPPQLGYALCFLKQRVLLDTKLLSAICLWMDWSISPQEDWSIQMKSSCLYFKERNTFSFQRLVVEKSFS